MDSYPYFAILLMYLRFMAVDNIRNISTNGRCIFFNADFIAKLYPNELDFILCHQIMHIVNGDIWRSRARMGDDYHRACDIYNNDQLIGIGWKVSSFTHLGKLQYQIPMFTGEVGELSPKEILELLPYSLSVLDERTRKRYMTDSDFYWDYKQSNFVDGIVILDAPEMSKYLGENSSENQAITGAGNGKILDGAEELEDFWMNQSEKAASIASSMGRKAGSIPGRVKRDIEKSKKRVVDWKKILDEFVQEEVTDYSFTPPDRRYVEAGFFLPDFNERDYTPKDILFMADTSASVKREDLSRVYDEISGAIEQFNGKLCGKLGFFDVEVSDPIPFESVEEIAAIIPYGGGGTSFHVIFDYVREHLNEFVPAMLVVFTDGFADFPEQEMAMNIPVLWLISNDEVTPPWGKVGRVV
jgi:predicted metal-dependent peptidase